MSGASTKGCVLLLVLLALIVSARCGNREDSTKPPSDPECFIIPDSLDFHDVAVGSHADLRFTIANKGGGILAGTLEAACAAFAITSGGGSFALDGGKSRQVTIRFQPATVGVHSCRISLGAPWPEVACAGTAAEPPPLCRVSPDTLRFGEVAPDSSRDLSFTISNSGGRILSGAIGLGCDNFRVVEGSGGYALEPGGAHVVTIRFIPSGCGSRECRIAIGDVACAGVVCVGQGEGTGCRTSPSALDFGTVPLGESVDRAFTLTNTGCGTLDGNLSLDCADYAFVVGGGAYSLAPGRSHTVTIRFNPSRCGSSSCSVDPGNGLCPPAVCTGTGSGGLCDVSPSALDFGDVLVGQSADRSFTIRNTGCETVSGTVGTSCPEYTLSQGGGAYSLTPGQAIEVTVRFRPAGCYASACAIDLGDGICPSVSCEGTGIRGSCSVSPAQLEFGSVTPGSFADRTFTIVNEGCEPLEGTILESCPEFSVVTGGGSYRLGLLESRVVTLRFSPTAPGARSCAVSLGNGSCRDVSCSAVGSGTGPACDVAPPAIDFGVVPVGEHSDRSFTITNSGTGGLSGTVSESCPDYEIRSGQGGFSLGTGESREVIVRFTPATCGAKGCEIDLGSALCGTVACAGEGGGGGCSVTPATLDFGTVAVGQSLDRSFTIKNEGCEPVAGNVAAPCAGYEIVAGGGAYTLSAGQSLTVTVRFTPAGCGTASCTVETGNPDCLSVACAGIGGGTACQVSPTTLSFGTVAVGDSAERSFTIANTGCARLTGSVAETCADYRIVRGQGAFTLDPAQTDTVIVRFLPTGCGTKSCTIDTGIAGCSDVSCSGTGGGTGCTVSPTALDFGTVLLGQSAQRTFTLTNDGCGNLSGTIVESCPDYSFVSGGGSYSLSLGQSLTVTVRFTPTACGVRTCAIDTGNEICDAVDCVGTGGGTACEVSPATLDFGTVIEGAAALRTFTITNTGCEPLTGFVSALCADYGIAAGGGAYTLQSGQAREVTVRFSPTGCGTSACSIETGNSLCSDVACTGIGGGIECTVAPATLDFGTVALGQSADRSFTIKNTGCTAVSGTVSETCGSFSIIKGLGAYSLQPGAADTVTVRFTPAACGASACTVDTGSATCGDVSCTGTGGGASCSVSPASLDFGTIVLGQSADRTFTIRNTGCTTIAGTVTDTCPDYSITKGLGAFSLPPGAIDTVTVRFTPTACGTLACTVATGSAICGGVPCVGIGTGTGCAVTPSVLDFGTVVVGQSSDRSFTIENTGCATIEGTVTDTCPGYSIIKGLGAFSLPAGAIDTVTVRFTPTACGTSACTIGTGSVLCGGVACSGIGSPAVPVTFVAIADATIMSGFPDSTGCTVTLDRVGFEAAGAGELRTLLRFDLSTIPANATVTQAELVIRTPGCTPPPAGGRVTVNLYEITAPWGECAVTWSGTPSGSDIGCASSIACSPPGSRTISCAPLLPAVQDWVATPAANHGIALYPAAGGDGALQIYSRRSGEFFPLLRVWYTCP